MTIVVDQFSANLFDQYRGRFTGGLRRMADQGLVSINGYQSHGLTETCPGHSTVLTGMHPVETGIPANDWIDAKTGKEVYCLASTRNHLAHGRDDTDNGPVGTEQLQATTVGDWLKAVSPESKVFGVSGKDRGAINLAGHQGQAFWFTDGFGLTTYVEPGQTAEGATGARRRLQSRLQRLAGRQSRELGLSERRVPRPWLATGPSGGRPSIRNCRQPGCRSTTRRCWTNRR